VDYFFRGLLGFGTDIRDIDLTRLNVSNEYMSEDMIAFIELMRTESDTPSMVMSDTENRRVINMTLSEMLERALLFEHHIEKYPDNTSTEAAQRLYEEIATNAIAGGYDSTEGIAHYYQGDTENVVDSNSIQYYEQFIEANPNSNLAKVVDEYITLLVSNQYQLTDEVEDFYKSLYSKLDVDSITANLANQTSNNTSNES
jgi:methyltransferase-like protein